MKARALQSVLLIGCMMIFAGCGEVDKGDGTVVGSVDTTTLPPTVIEGNVILPTDSALKLFCPDAGIADEPCILDDPDNPYALTPVTDDTKFDLSDAAPSAKARFYVWATAQAISPRGENQFNVGAALHEMFSESGSELAREQALKAYRSVLDNYFFSATFFEADFLPPPDIFFPFPVRKLVGQNMVSPSTPLLPLFDQPIQALEQFGQWGYTYDDQGTEDFTPNF